jgi:hypothetical protein
MRRNFFCQGTSAAGGCDAEALVPAADKDELMAKDSPARTSGTVAAAVFRNLRRSIVNMG